MKKYLKNKINEIKMWICEFNNRLDTDQEMIETMGLLLFFFFLKLSQKKILILRCEESKRTQLCKRRDTKRNSELL